MRGKSRPLNHHHGQIVQKLNFILKIKKIK